MSGITVLNYIVLCCFIALSLQHANHALSLPLIHMACSSEAPLDTLTNETHPTYVYDFMQLALEEVRTFIQAAPNHLA